MYDEPDVSGVDDPTLRNELRQYVLTVGEVAELLDVSQQAVAQWTKLNQIAHVTEPASKSDRHYAKHRYNLRGVVERAKETNRMVHLYAAPMRLLTQYDIAAVIENPGICLYTPPEGAHAPEWMSESEAARTLFVHRSTLYLKRTKGQLNPKVRTRKATLGGIEYAVESVQAVLADELELFRPGKAKAS